MKQDPYDPEATGHKDQRDPLSLKHPYVLHMALVLLCYTILYYTILYYTILYNAML